MELDIAEMGMRKAEMLDERTRLILETMRQFKQQSMTVA